MLKGLLDPKFLPSLIPWVDFVLVSFQLSVGYPTLILLRLLSSSCFYRWVRLLVPHPFLLCISGQLNKPMTNGWYMVSLATQKPMSNGWYTDLLRRLDLLLTLSVDNFLFVIIRNHCKTIFILWLLLFLILIPLSSVQLRLSTLLLRSERSSCDLFSRSPFLAMRKRYIAGELNSSSSSLYNQHWSSFRSTRENHHLNWAFSSLFSREQSALSFLFV